MTLTLPPRLASPVMSDGEVAVRLMLDLTVYLVGPTEQELELFVDLQERFWPKGASVEYAVLESNELRAPSNPEPTLSVREALAKGVKRPFLAPVRKRIQQQRAFTLFFQNGQSFDDPQGRTFRLQAIKLRKKGVRSVLRLMLPLDTELAVLRQMTVEVAEQFELHSGHAGLTFAASAEQDDALDIIYGLARRYWGVDVEDLNATLPVSAEGIKAVSWLTLVGRRWLQEVPELVPAIDALNTQGVTVEPHAKAVMLVAGPQPVVGDQNRPDKSLNPLVAVAKALAPIFLTEHPDFNGGKFIDNDNTLGWVRRLIEPDGWR
jgi:hypothetical protein